MNSKVSAKVVTSRLAWIQEMLAGITALPMESETRFTQDPRNAAAAESYLRRAIEALLDLGRHLLAKGFGQAVSEYKEIANALHEAGLLTAEEARLMRDIAGYHNRLVHFYDEISTTELYHICVAEAADVERLADKLARWVKEHPEQVNDAL
jgi:uncharacterized protein YutE (UPF0331/DUF86 family)